MNGAWKSGNTGDREGETPQPRAADDDDLLDEEFFPHPPFRLRDNLDGFLDSSPAFAAASRQSFLHFVDLANRPPPTQSTSPGQETKPDSSSRSQSASDRVQTPGMPSAAQDASDRSSEAQRSSSLTSQPTQESTTGQSSKPEQAAPPRPPPPAPSISGTKRVQPVLLPPEYLLPALDLLIEKLADGVDEKSKRLSIRKFTHCDIQKLIDNHASYAVQMIKFDPYKPLNFHQYELIAREAAKTMAASRSRRLTLYMLGGITLTHMVHRLVSKVSRMQRILKIITSIIFPTPVIGPLLGMLAAMSWEDKYFLSL